MTDICFKQISSLEKVFVDKMPECRVLESASAMKGEEYSYQIAFSKPITEEFSPKTEFEVKVNSVLSPYIKVRKVMHIPSELCAYQWSNDDGYYKKDSGLFPDALLPLEENKIFVTPHSWHSLWVNVYIPKDFSAGEYDIEIVFESEEELQKTNLKLEVMDLELKKQELIFTQWFHGDCIASVHNVDVFSEEHWDLLRKYIKTAADNGINMILTPIFTPPLDTQIGGERPTIQLVDCNFENGKYAFSFDKLTRWIDMCLECGIEYFEISHLFTQWGAKFAPKIVVLENGEYVKKFGWHTNSDSDEYVYFLKEFLPTLTGYLKNKGISNKVYFHISDEPNNEHIESYCKAQNIVIPFLEGFKVIDALSNVEFYKNGLVKIPVPSNSHIKDFLECDIEERWTYYCCAQSKNVSNRFFAMPSTRNRIIGAQFYKFGIKGFLQWGYNFYYSQYSKEVINPYLTTDAGNAFPSGDAFSVYPYKNGVAESIRLKVFKNALQDMRAMQMLEEKKGRDFVVRIIEETCECELKFDQFPFWGDYILDYRERINQELKNCI